MKMLSTFVLAAVAATSMPVSASDATDPRWTALLGCWAPDNQAADAESNTAPAHVICLLPTDGAGITIATIADGRIVSEQALIANGSRRDVSEGGCSGYESASWSQDGRRVFLESDLTCTGGVKRTSRGILALVSPASYVDVQAVMVEGEEAARTVRYVALDDADVPAVVGGRLAAEPMAREAARMRAATALDFDDVVEATRVAGGAAVEGLLVARRAGFDLDARALRSLSASGVSASTIDVMVALSYPDHFAVEEEAPRPPRGLVAGGFGDDRIGVTSRGSCYDDNMYDRWDSRYARCGYRSYYSPYGYDGYGWNYGSRPVVIVQPGNGDGEERENGEFVKGRGYTRKGASEGTARPRATPAAPSTGTRATEGTGTKAGTAAPSSKPAGSGSDTGRTAKPRGGGK